MRPGSLVGVLGAADGLNDTERARARQLRYARFGRAIYDELQQYQFGDYKA